MSGYHLKYLDRAAYIASVEKIQDLKTSKFADMSLRWWDKHFSWKPYGCVVLCDQDEKHLCYMFYKIDSYKQYLTIHNIFTPLQLRRHGYAYELLKIIFALGVSLYVSRFKLICISRSLDFYLSIGFVYWGVNCVGDYYCDLPLPKDGLDGLKKMVAGSSVETLIGKNKAIINKRVSENHKQLSVQQSIIYEADKEKMGSRYMLGDLLQQL
jgi:hypothetical protein